MTENDFIDPVGDVEDEESEEIYESGQKVEAPKVNKKSLFQVLKLTHESNVTVTPRRIPFIVLCCVSTNNRFVSFCFT